MASRSQLYRQRGSNKGGRNKQTENEENMGPFTDAGTDLPHNDPWIRGHGLAVPSKLLHTLKIKLEMNGVIRSIDSGL